MSEIGGISRLMPCQPIAANPTGSTMHRGNAPRCYVTRRRPQSRHRMHEWPYACGNG